MASDRLYSSFVKGLKVLLPLAALVILSSVFYFSRGSDEARRLPLAIGEDQNFLRERIGLPEYLTVMSDGSALRVTAEIVVPVDGKRNTYDAEEISGRIEVPEGRTIFVTAPEGRLNIRRDVATLTGIVSVNTSDGFHFLTDDLHAKIREPYGESGGPVRGEAPFGRLEAGLMKYGLPPALGLEGTEEDPPLLHFTEGVKVVYEPRK